MLIKSVFLGLVLASLVLAVPTRIDENRNEIDGTRDNKLIRREAANREEMRRAFEREEEMMKKDNERRGSDEKEEKRAMFDKDEERHDNERRETENKEERRRETDRKTEEEKEERRRELKENKEEEKEERRRELNEERESKEEKEQRRREAKENKEKEERRREIQKEIEKKKEQHRRELNELKKEMQKEEERREAEQHEEEKEERREAKDEEKKEERREPKDEEKKEERRRMAEERRQEEREERRREIQKESEKKKEQRRRELNELKKEMQKDEERREAENKEERRRETDRKTEEEKEERRRELNEERENKEKEQRRREAKEKMEKEERRREIQKENEKKKEERRRELNELKKEMQKDEERREAEERRRETERHEEEKEERREAKDEEKKEERREPKDEEKKEERRRATMNKESEREKRRPIPAIKGEKRESDNQREEISRVKRESEKETRDVEKNTTSNVFSICESVTDFKYYQKYESDPAKYIQCDPWGSGSIKSCPEGLLWNEWTLKCDVKEHIHNMTLDLSKFSVTTAARPLVNCSLVGMECLNGGSCVQSTSGDYKCACRTDYTGQFCESRVDLTDITHEILNSTFSVVAYRKRLEEENITMGVSYYEKYKDQLDNLTYTELVRYLKFYKDGEVRYDTLVNSLVEDILENIYPDAEYLSVFNASEQNVITMVQMIPPLLSYSRYSFERYEDVFAQYQHVLVTLGRLLNASYPNISEEASQYTLVTRIFLNQTLTLIKNLEDRSLIEDNQKLDQPIQLSEEDIKKSLQRNYNDTQKAAERLIAVLEKFQASVLHELETNPSGVMNLTLGQAKFAGAQEVLTILNDVSVASYQIWESLVNYGFWYLTNLFSTSPSKIESIKRYTFNLNKF